MKWTHTICAAVLLFVAAIPSPGISGELNSREIIADCGYEIGVMGGYGWAMDGLVQEPDIEHAVLLASVSVPMSRNEMGASFYRGIVEYQCEAGIGNIVQPNQRMEFGITPIGFKYNFTRLGCDISPYSNFGFGVIYEPIGHHVQGSNFNFILQTGLGVQYFLDDKTTLNFEYRYRHVSNANYEKPNSSINSSFVLVGASFF
jgi:hypothetical protein